jgi:hypothetical protein
MVKPLPLLILAGLLVGCASAPEADEVERAPGTQPLQLSCYQAGWQAETVPIIYKRGGPAAWEKYEFMPAMGPVACR